MTLIQMYKLFHYSNKTMQAQEHCCCKNHTVDAEIHSCAVGRDCLSLGKDEERLISQPEMQFHRSPFGGERLWWYFVGHFFSLYNAPLPCTSPTYCEDNMWTLLNG